MRSTQLNRYKVNFEVNIQKKSKNDHSKLGLSKICDSCSILRFWTQGLRQNCMSKTQEKIVSYFQLLNFVVIEINNKNCKKTIMRRLTMIL